MAIHADQVVPQLKPKVERFTQSFVTARRVGLGLVADQHRGSLRNAGAERPLDNTSGAVLRYGVIETLLIGRLATPVVGDDNRGQDGVGPVEREAVGDRVV